MQSYKCSGTSWCMICRCISGKCAVVHSDRRMHSRVCKWVVTHAAAQRRMWMCDVMRSDGQENVYVKWGAKNCDRTCEVLLSLGTDRFMHVCIVRLVDCQWGYERKRTSVDTSQRVWVRSGVYLHSDVRRGTTKCYDAICAYAADIHCSDARLVSNLLS
jgi:hypothetical protein